MKDVGIPRHRRSFTPERRVKAAHMVIDARRLVADVARELDMDTSLLQTWVRDERWRIFITRGATAQRTDPIPMADSSFRRSSVRSYCGYGRRSPSRQ